MVPDDGSEQLGRVLRFLGLAEGVSLRLMRKHRRILCAVPEERDLALRTLGLYSPQRCAGRVAAAAVRAGIRAGRIRWVLPESVDSPAGGGTLASCGVMLGSAGHQVERAVAVRPRATGIEVVKVAFGERGREILEGEAAMLRDPRVRRSGAPELLGIESRDGGTALWMPWDEGAPYRNAELGPVVSLLRAWTREGERRALSEFEEGPLAMAELERRGVDAGRRERIASRPVAPALRHGDFARWNLRLGPGGDLRVHDWERGRPEGPAGFDIVHYLVQEALLVRRLPPRPLIRQVRQALSAPPVAEYLARAGWQGAEDDLILGTVAFTTAAGYEDQSSLLREMLATR